MSPVYISVEPGALSCLRDTLDSLFEYSTNVSKIVIVGVPANDAEIRRIADRSNSTGITLELAFAEAADHLSLALGMAAGSGGASGALFVKSGVMVPYAWDARLERIAQHDPTIGTVSPLCDSFPMFALLGDEAQSQIEPSDTQYVDSLTFSLSSRTYIEVPCFLADCFYVSPAALELANNNMNIVDQKGPSSYWTFARLLSAHGYLNVLGDCLYIYNVQQAETESSKYLLAQGSVISMIRAEPFKSLGLKVLQCISDKIAFKDAPGLDPRPVQLHVQHSWGGGLEKWVRDFCSADDARVNLILKSSGRHGAYGERLMLFTSADDTAPLQTWEFSFPIQATTVSNLEYANAIDEIIRRYSVDAILVSSLIGHSLDILNTSKQTILICHDYYPYCPAINITFGAICTNCGFPRLEQCFTRNPYNHPFRKVGASDWDVMREAYLSRVLDKKLKMVIPSRSIKDNLVKLEPRYRNVDFVFIPHGVSPMQAVECLVPHRQSGHTRLRVLVLGNIAKHKGLNLLKEIAGDLASFADLFLVGCGEEGKYFENRTSGKVVYSYDLEELPLIIHEINPDIGLLPSVVPESFSYTLSELTGLRVPVLATRLGSFAERIEDGKTGFLAEPRAADIVRKIRALDADRAQIEWVKENLAQVENNSIAEMISAYQRILPLANLPIARFPIEQHFKPMNFLGYGRHYRELLQNENKLALILSSRSWRVTAPLRWVSNFVARLTGRNG